MECKKCSIWELCFES